jgi:succinate dehydrogenase / fumarate reductase iron-sulfur subunit
MVTLKVRRSLVDGISRTDTFQVSLEDRMTVLDALFLVQREQDPSLAFRCSCRVGMCGTCAMNIDGVPRLACKTRASTLQSKTIHVEPLPNLPVIRDLVVSLQPFFEQWKKVLPGLHAVNRESQELARIPASSAYARETLRKRDCITCGACYSACGIKSSNTEYLGPAAINKAFLRLVDPRDGAKRERLRVLNGEYGGVWRCHTQFNCTAVCPKGINLTDTIVRLKRAMLWPAKFQRI